MTLVSAFFSTFLVVLDLLALQVEHNMLTLSLKSLKQSERQSRVTIIMYLHWHILRIVKAHNTSVEGDNTVMEGDNNIVTFLLKQNTSYLDRQYGYLQCRKLLGWSMNTLKIIYSHVILNNSIEDNHVQRGMIICYDTLRLVLKRYKYNMKKTTLFLCFYFNLFGFFVGFLCLFFINDFALSTTFKISYIYISFKYKFVEKMSYNILKIPILRIFEFSIFLQYCMSWAKCSEIFKKKRMHS